MVQYHTRGSRATRISLSLCSAWTVEPSTFSTYSEVSCLASLNRQDFSSLFTLPEFRNHRNLRLCNREHSPDKAFHEIVPSSGSWLQQHRRRSLALSPCLFAPSLIRFSRASILLRQPQYNFYTLNHVFAKPPVLLTCLLPHKKQDLLDEAQPLQWCSQQNHS